MCKNRKTSSAQVQGNVSSKSESENYYNGLKYYNITGHKWALFGWIVGIGILCIFIFAFFSGGIEWIFRIIGIWESKGDKSHLNLNILPDFLGGMIGILVGFFLDWFIFDKFRCLVKYEAILSVLNAELKDIINTIKDNKPVDLIILRNIVESEENSVIIYNLPHGWIFSNKHSGEIFNKLRFLYNSVRNYIDAKANEDNNIEQYKTKFYTYVIYFKKLTDSTYQSISYSEAYNKLLVGKN